MAVTPASINLARGGSGNATISVTRGGAFTDAVALTQVGAPAGVTVAFIPTSVPAGSTSSTVSVAVASSVATGNYPVTISATGTDVITATTTLTVAVEAGADGGVAVEFCAASAPIWVAEQDGSGPWTRVLPNAGTSAYQFAFPSGQGGIAAVYSGPNDWTYFNVFYATGAEFSGMGGVMNLLGCGAKTVQGTVALNLAATEIAFVTLGSSYAYTGPDYPHFPAFVITDVPEGSLDLIAALSDVPPSSFGLPYPIATSKIILRRAQNIAAGGHLAVLDFAGAEAFAPGTANVTVTGLGSDEAAEIFANYTGLYGSAFGVISTIPSYASSSGAVAYRAIPVANLNIGELQQLWAVTEDDLELNDRYAGVYFHALADKTIALGPWLSWPTVTNVVTAPNARPRIQLPGQAQYNRLFSADYTQIDLKRSANIVVTAGYFGGAPATWDVALPDLSAATGWNTAFGLLDGVGIDWGVGVQGGASRFLDGNFTDGSTFQGADTFGHLFLGDGGLER